MTACDPHLPARFFDPAIYDPEFLTSRAILHERGRLCVDCSNPNEPVEGQRKIYHPAYRGCVLRPELKESAE